MPVSQSIKIEKEDIEERSKLIQAVEEKKQKKLEWRA
jgi:hypothetical protein